MAKYTRLKVLLVKTEVTYGTDAAPTGGANAMLAFNVQIKPMMGQDAARKFEREYFSAAQKLPTGLYMEISGEIEMVGNAAPGTAPGWSALAKACGLAEVITASTSVAYNPVSVNHGSATIHYYDDGVRHALTGCRGTAEIKLNAHGVPMLAFRMMGIYADPTDVANPATTLTSFQTPQPANKVNTPTFTINGVACVMRSYTLNLGNSLVYRELVGSQEVLISDREATLQAQVNAVTMATLNPFTLAKNQTSFAVSLVHGVGAGKIVTVNCPACRMSRVEGYTEQDGIREWPLAMTPLPTAGNDEFTITLT
jgi:hypothetical protein